MFNLPIEFSCSPLQMSAKRSPPLWKLPDLRTQGTPQAAANSTHSSSTSSNQTYSMASEGQSCRQEAVGGSPKQPRVQDISAKPSEPLLNSIKPTCCPFATLRATSLRLQSNEHTWDTLLLRFLRLEPGEVIRNLSKNHVIEARVSHTTIKREKELQWQSRLTSHPRYFAIHLLDGIKPPTPSSTLLSSTPPNSPAKSHACGRYIEVPLSQDFIKHLKLVGSICFWCNEHRLWYEVSVFTGQHEGSWR
jgi:hypothetical protein